MSDLTHYQQPSNEIAVPDSARSLVEWARSADAAYSLAQKLVGTSFCPQQFRGKPEEAAAAMLSGAEVGLSPMAALRSFDVIQGTAAPRALTLRAVAQSFGHEFVTVEESPSKVVMRGRRRGSGEWETVTWTIQRATQLKLTGKDNWQKQPQAMLVARATSELARRIAADAILGIGYSAEEIEDGIAPATTTVTRESAEKRTVSRKRKPEPEPQPEPQPEPEVASEPEPGSDEPAPPGITEKQSRHLHALVNELGLTREQKLAGLSQITGRTITTSSDLTEGEASWAIDSLKARADAHKAEVGA